MAGKSARKMVAMRAAWMVELQAVLLDFVKAVLRAHRFAGEMDMRSVGDLEK